jgi:hypothetical protein
MIRETRQRVSEILRSCVNSAIERVGKNKMYHPFHTALLTPKLVTASSFERSFSTSFGQGPIEEMSRIIALATGAESVRHKETMANITKGAQDEITRIIAALRDGTAKPQWGKELKRICACKKGDLIVSRVISDLWIKRKGVEIFLSLKTVKPNIDQTEIAKKDMLLLKAQNENYEPYFALYYNPGGTKRADYNWVIPSKMFDMLADPCVLIGEDYWDFVGGKGTYKDLLSIFEEVGQDTRKKLETLGH